MNTRRLSQGGLRRGRLAAMLSAALIAVAGFSSGAAAQMLTTLYTFTGGSDGGNPYAGLIADAAGNLYGTTYGSVNGGGGPSRYGTVFELTPSGTFTVLYSFTGGSDGANPRAGLIADAAGSLYGTTISGGVSCGELPHGCGTVFQLTPSGTLNVLHSFTGSDGSQPFAALVADAAGNLYGTTYGGGATASCDPPNGCGTVFKLAPSGILTVLYSFTGSSDGAYPFGALVADAAGNLYGTTTLGGATASCNPPSGCGTVFELVASGSLTVLHSFTGFFGSDGSSPYAGLIADATGKLYGTTFGGGAYGHGTVFELAPSGILTVLYSFTGDSDGAYPYASLIADATGNLYGMTGSGGAYGYGTVFELAPSGILTVLYSFTGDSDGAYPYAGLIADWVAGNLYGTTTLGGATASCNPPYGCGTVFQLTLPLSPTGSGARQSR
jgi:uncharacterized repeat protein (TIGR03803 family)